jgi:hypothetical protein
VYSKNLLKQSIIYFFINFLKLKVMNTTKVTVLADQTTNAVINPSNNPEYGYVKVSQVRPMIDEKSGFLRPRVVTALIPGLVTDLQLMSFYAGQQLDGKVVIEESLAPFNSKTPERDLKVAGSTGIVCTVDGAPIYRRTKFSFDVNAQDTFVKHTNVEELRAAYAIQEGTSSAINNARPAEDLSI